MKKKIMLCFLLCSIAGVFAGCGADKETEAEETVSVEEEAEIPVFGQEDIADYSGFQYLHSETITAEIAQGKKKEVTVFLPGETYINDEGCLVGNGSGINFQIMAQNYYIMENSTVEENLQGYFEVAHDPAYMPNIEDLTVSEIEKTGENAVAATAEYCNYDVATDSYSVHVESYYVVTLENGVTLQFVVTVKEENVTEETEAIIEELETFYPFEIAWDAQAAKEKKEAYLAAGDMQ